MINIELSRAIAADRQRDLDRALSRRREDRWRITGAGDRETTERRSAERRRLEGVNARAFGQSG